MNIFSAVSSGLHLSKSTPPLPPLLSPLTTGLINYLDFSSNSTVTISSGNNISAWKNLVNDTTNNLAVNCTYGVNTVNGVNIGLSQTSPGYLYFNYFASSVSYETLFYVFSINAAPPNSSTRYCYLASSLDQTDDTSRVNNRYYALLNTYGTNIYQLTSAPNLNGSVIQYSSTFSITYGQKYLLTITRSLNTSCSSSRLNGVSINTSFNYPININYALIKTGFMGVKNNGQKGATNVYLPYTLYEHELYNIDLSLSDIQRTEQYLRNKWSI
jgi:hypothetical protein